jgi:penicillin-binding protein 1C
MTFQGTVSVRKALQLSLNVPAIAVLDRLGTSRLAARLTQVGAHLVLPANEAPGLAMGLGGVGVTLEDLTMLYRALATNGEVTPVRERGTDTTVPARRLIGPVAAWQVGNILFGTPPPENAPQGRIAFKTGTSYGYRDAWSVGFDGRMTIGVWVGRPDGAPVSGMIGRAVAAPILFDAFARSGYAPLPLPSAPKGTLIATNGRLPPPLRHYRAEGDLGSASTPRIMFPPNGARIELSGGDEPQPLMLKVQGGVGVLTVLMNGIPVADPSRRRTLFVAPDGRGFTRLTVMDARGGSDSVIVRIQ